ncbi:6066_t:CDS:2, partial [Gigaspora margarita]
MPPPHNFRDYFTLQKNPNNPTNALAICKWCIRKFGLSAAQQDSNCYTVNRAHIESDTNESLNLRTNSAISITSSHSVISTTSSHPSINSQQSAITNFICRPLSVNNQLRFEQLLLRMIVSNALSFTFVENEDTIAVFEFLVPGIKLLKRKVIGGKVLMKSAQLLQNNIIK